MNSEIRSKALDLLARREHSRCELQRKLLERGFTESEINPLLEKLVGEGLQSDERFTEIYIRSRVRSGFGPIRITMELRERGVDGDLIKISLEEYSPDWLELVESVHKKKFGTKFGKDFKEQSKQARFLQYKGFTNEQIKHVLDICPS